MGYELLPFIGEAEQTVDKNNRVIIPVSFRENLQGHFFLCKGINEPCVWILPDKVFRSLLKKLRMEIPISNKEGQRWIGSITAAASRKKLDVQNRLTIPPNLLKLAGITGKVKLVGHDERAEIWALDRWQADHPDFYDQSPTIDEKYDLKGYTEE